MLQAILLSMLAIEAVFYVWFGNFLSDRGMRGLAIAATLLLIALLWRLSHTLGSFVVTSVMRWRDGRPLPWDNSVAALAKEFAARVICFNWSQAFPQIAVGHDPCGAKRGMPILLVHGYLCNSGLWMAVRRRFADAGLGPIYTLTLTPLFGAIDTLVPKLDARIEAICVETGAEKLLIVAHSMGGLVVRAYLAQVRTPASALRVAKLVTLGVPHHGTRLAKRGLGVNARQMRFHSEWLKRLVDKESAATERNGPPATLSIYTLNDDIVYPPESSVLQWAENVPVSAVGHMGLVFSAAVTARVIRYLR